MGQVTNGAWSSVEAAVHSNSLEMLPFLDIEQDSSSSY